MWFVALFLLLDDAGIYFFLVALGCGLTALVIGSVSWLILRRKKVPAEARKAGFGALLGLGFFLAVGLIMPALAASERKAMISNCRANQQDLATVLRGEAKTQGRFPLASNWLAQLRDHNGLPPKRFGCPFHTNDACAFAFNAKLSDRAYTNVSGDTVLLFEARPGGANFGGAELASPHSHSKGDIAVVFVDSSQRRLPLKKVPSLRWNP